MNCDPIICSGNDLFDVLAGVRANGGFIEALDTRVGGKNGNYRVSYFERVAELADAAVVGSDHSRKWPSQAIEGSTTSVLNHFPKQSETVTVESIETRLSALQAKLVASGKLMRSKPSTRNEHARTPYKDD